MAKTGKIRDLWQNFEQNLHFLTNEKRHFLRQNPLQPSYQRCQTWTAKRTVGDLEK